MCGCDRERVDEDEDRARVVYVVIFRVNITAIIRKPCSEMIKRSRDDIKTRLKV